uniref:Uncharacterized protein n=1 Tax=Rhizophora mucronata TaxID=61149 RepID=A0A2P2N9L3_RHIMU
MPFVSVFFFFPFCFKCLNFLYHSLADCIVSKCI